jgi:hypothetical protein
MGLSNSRPERLNDLVEYIQFECEFDYRAGLPKTLKALESLPPSPQSVCLLPALLEERERLAKLFKNENESPLEFNDEFNPLSLRTGWWNLKPFQNSSIEPSKALLRWIIVNEALRRNIHETQDVFRRWFSRVTDQSSAITFPLIAAYFESPILIVRVQRFIEASRCERFQIACQEMRNQVIGSYQAATAKAQERITTLLNVLDHPLPGTTVEEVEQLRAVREAAHLLARIREQPGTSLGLMNSKASLTTLLESYKSYRDTLFDLGSIPKSLDDSALAKALTGSLILTELEKQVPSSVTVMSPQQSAHGPLTQALVDDLMRAAKSLEQLIFFREVSL